MSTSSTSSSSPPAASTDDEAGGALPPSSSPGATLQSLIQQLTQLASPSPTPLLSSTPSPTLLLLSLRLLLLRSPSPSPSPASPSLARNLRIHSTLHSLLTRSSLEAPLTPTPTPSPPLLLPFLHSCFTLLTALLTLDPVGAAAFTASIGLPTFLAPLTVHPPPAGYAGLGEEEWGVVAVWLAWVSIGHLGPSSTSSPSPSPSSSPSPSLSLASLLPLPMRPHLRLLHPTALLPLLSLLPRTSPHLQRTLLFWLLALTKADPSNSLALSSTPHLIPHLLPLLPPPSPSTPLSLPHEAVRSAVWRVLSHLLRFPLTRSDVKALSALMDGGAPHVIQPLLEAVQEGERGLRGEGGGVGGGRGGREGGDWPYIDLVGQRDGGDASGGWLEVGMRDETRPFPPPQGYTVSMWVYVEEATAEAGVAGAGGGGSGAGGLFAPSSSLPRLPPPYVWLASLVREGRLRWSLLLTPSYLTAVMETTTPLRSTSHSTATFTAFTFHSHTWYHLTLKHSPPTSRFSSAASATLYVDGEFIATLPLAYPSPSPPPPSASPSPSPPLLLLGPSPALLSTSFTPSTSPSPSSLYTRHRLASFLLSDLPLNDLQCAALYTGHATHPRGAGGNEGGGEGVVRGGTGGEGAEEEDRKVADACRAEWWRFGMSEGGDVGAGGGDGSAVERRRPPAPTSFPPLAVPLSHLLLYLHPTSAFPSPTGAAFRNLVADCTADTATSTSTPTPNPTSAPPLTDATPHGRVHAFVPSSFLTSYLAQGGLSHLLLLLSNTTDSSTFLHLLQLLLLLLSIPSPPPNSSITPSSHPYPLTSFNALHGPSLIASAIEDRPSLLTPPTLSALYALVGLSPSGRGGTLRYLPAFSLLFLHTLFLLPLPLPLRVRLYQPLIAALMDNPQRDVNVAVMREQGLVTFLLSLLSSRLVPLGREPGAGGAGGRGAVGGGEVVGGSEDAEVEDVVEQVKNVLFLMWVDGVVEREVRAVAYFLLSDNQQVVAATSFSAAAAVRELNVQEVAWGWWYDASVKSSLLDLLLGVLLNSSPSTLRVKAAAAPSPHPVAIASPTSLSPTMAAPAPSSTEVLFTTLLQPSFLLILLAQLQSSSDRVAALAARAEGGGLEVDHNPPLRAVLLVLKLLITLTLRYPAYLQAMQQEMAWTALSDIFAFPTVSSLTAADTPPVLSALTGVVSGHYNVVGLLLCLLLGREVDGYVDSRPLLRASSPLRTLPSNRRSSLTPAQANGATSVNPLLTIYQHAKTDPRYTLHLHAPEVFSLLLLMSSSHSLYLLHTAPPASSSSSSTSSPPPSSTLLMHVAELLDALTQDSAEFRAYATHATVGVQLLEQVGSALFTAAECRTRMLDAAVVEAAPPAAEAATSNGVDSSSAKAAHADGPEREEPPPPDSSRPASEAVQTKLQSGTADPVIRMQRAEASVEGKQVLLTLQSTLSEALAPSTSNGGADSEWSSTGDAVVSEAVDSAAAELSPTPPPFPADDAQHGLHRSFDADETEAEAQPLLSPSSSVDPLLKDAAADSPAEVVQSPPSLSPDRLEDDAGFDAHSVHASSEASGVTDSSVSSVVTPSTPSPQLTSPLLSLVEELSPLSSPDLDGLADQATAADEPRIFASDTFTLNSTSAPSDDPYHHHRTSTLSSLADDLLDAEAEEAAELAQQAAYEEEQRSEAEERMRQRREEEEELSRAKAELFLARRRLEEEEASRVSAEVERLRREEEEELRRYEQLQAEAEAEVEAEAQAELEQQRLAAEAAHAKREAAERQRLAEKERLRALEEERERAETELLRQHELLNTSPVSFTDATSQAVLAFFADLLSLSHQTARPYVPGPDSDSSGPMMSKRLDTGVEGYVVKVPHASSHSDARSQAWTLLYDLLALAPLPVLHSTLRERLPPLVTAYQNAVLSTFVRLLLADDAQRCSSLLLSSSTFAHSFAQCLCLITGRMRCGLLRGGGGLLLMELMAKCLSFPTLLSILSSAPPPPNANKSPDENRRTAHVLLASLHLSMLLLYAEGLGLDPHLATVTPSFSQPRGAKRRPRDLVACNRLVLAHRQVILGVLVQQEKHHAYVACLLHSLLQQVWVRKAEDKALAPHRAVAGHRSDRPSTAAANGANGHTDADPDEVSWQEVRTSAVQVLIALLSYPRAVAYVTALLSGKHAHVLSSLAPTTSGAPLQLLPASLLPSLSIGLNMLHRGDEANFWLWAAHSQAELAPALASSLGLAHSAFVRRMEAERTERRQAEDAERVAREAVLRARSAKVDAGRVEVGVRVRLLEADVKERRVKAEQEKKREERKEKKVNAKMLRKKLEVTRRQDEMRERREEDIERRKRQRPLSAVQWNALASASALDDRQQWQAQLAHALAAGAASAPHAATPTYS